MSFKMCSFIRLIEWNLPFIVLLLNFAPAQGQAQGSGAGVVNSQACEQVINGVTNYYACLGLPEFPTIQNSSKHSVSVSPANITCGIKGQEAYTLGLYTLVTCPNPTSHPPSYMTDSIVFPDRGAQANLDSYWQSVTWWDVWDSSLTPTSLNKPLQADITLDFDHLYTLQQDILIKFQSSRPQKMMIEKSKDFGSSWEPLQYFSTDCEEYFRSGQAVRVITQVDPTAITCSGDYSEKRPYSGGEVRMPVVADRFGLFAGKDIGNYQALYQAYDTTALLDFLSFTNIRIRLLYPATDGREWSGEKKSLLRSWYGISNIELVTSCMCNLHARYCVLENDTTVCNCKHNTMGKNCELCQPLYNNRPWRRGSYMPFPQGTANECEKCQCYDHADSCDYSPADGKGICNNCQHNTMGKNCELCIPTYYHNATVPFSDPFTCVECRCELYGVKNTSNAVCSDRIGQCECKERVKGEKCDECVSMFYGLTSVEPFGQCKRCECNLLGTIHQDGNCDQVTGQCRCKENVCGRDCSFCCDGQYNFPNSISQGCLPCSCDPGGSVNTTCDRLTGHCVCKEGLRGQYCNITEPNFYVPFLDAYQFQPISGSCTPDSDLIREDRPFTGRTFYDCMTGQSVKFSVIKGAELLQPDVIWPYNPTIRYTYNSPDPWSQMMLTISVVGNSTLGRLPYYQAKSATRLAPNCPVRVGSIAFQVSMQNVQPGVGKAWMSPATANLDARCDYQVTVVLGASGNTSTISTISIDSVVLFPNLEASAVYKQADNRTKLDYETCQRQIAELRTRGSALAGYHCHTLSSATMAEMSDRALPCDCDSVGAIGTQSCDPYGGLCPCKPGAYGRRCDVCEPGYYNFNNYGCTVCTYFPCPEDPDNGSGNTKAQGGNGEGGTDSAMIGIIFIIIILIILLLLLVFFMSKRRYRDKIFKKCSKAEGLSYISLPEEKRTTQNPLYGKGVGSIPEEEDIDFRMRSANTASPVLSSPDLSRLERDDSIRSNAPIIPDPKDRKHISKQNKIHMEKEMSTQPVTFREPIMYGINSGKDPQSTMYYDNKVFDAGSTHDLLPSAKGKNSGGKDSVQQRKDYPDSAVRKNPLYGAEVPIPSSLDIFEPPQQPKPRKSKGRHVTEDHPASTASPQPSESNERPASSASRKLPPVPGSKVKKELPVLPAVSKEQPQSKSKSHDARQRERRLPTPVGVRSSESVRSTGSDVEGPRRKRELPSPKQSFSKSDRQNSPEKATKDELNLSLSKKPDGQSDGKQPAVHYQPKIRQESRDKDDTREHKRPSSKVKDSQTRVLPDKPRVPTGSAKPTDEPSQARASDKPSVARTASLVLPQTNPSVGRTQSSASDGPRKKKRGLPTLPGSRADVKQPGFESIWETDEVKGSLV